MSEEKIKIGKLDQIDPKQINANPHNPRYHFDDVKMGILLDSIKEVGILVPLIVYERFKDKQIYLLDGERRWRCALKLNMPKVPVNIVSEPSTLENLLRMFNIHNVSEKWELMPTALKLEVIIREIEKKQKHKVHKKALSLLTGLNQATVDRCIKLLSFAKEYQDLALYRKLPEDYLIEMYPVLNLIKKNLPEIYNKYSEQRLIGTFVEKRQRGVIKSPIEFRTLGKIISGSKKGISKTIASRVITRIIDDLKYTVNDAYESSAKGFYQAKTIDKKCKDLIKYLEPLDETDLDQKDKLSLLDILQRLKKIIDQKINKLQ